MGCCCSLLSSDGAPPQRETEMSSNESICRLKVSRAMTSPSIEIEGNTTVSGSGLALVSVAIEQDAAYWEIQIDGENIVDQKELMVGVATRKDRKFYSSSDEADDRKGTEHMRSIKVKNEDTVGVAVQQADLPMIQFMLNGELLHDLAINRFRGDVFPAVFLPEDSEGMKASIVFEESKFQEMSPHPRIGPLIEARGLV